MRETVAAAWPAFLDALADGQEVGKACKAHGFTHRQLRTWLSEQPAAVRQEYELAREESADALMDEAMNLARTNIDKEFATHARTRIDTLKWAARIRNPRLYGDKTTMDVNVKHVDLAGIIAAANARLLAARQPVMLPDAIAQDLTHDAELL